MQSIVRDRTARIILSFPLRVLADNDFLFFSLDLLSSVVVFDPEMTLGLLSFRNSTGLSRFTLLLLVCWFLLILENDLALSMVEWVTKTIECWLNEIEQMSSVSLHWKIKSIQKSGLLIPTAKLIILPFQHFTYKDIPTKWMH